MLPAADSYETLAAAFSWKVPAHYNIGVDACDKWADGSGRLALIYETREGSETRFTFDDLKALSNQFANALARAGLKRGDRVGIFLPQSPETAIAHLAIYKAGYIAVPLFQLFGVDAIQYRLADSGAAALITDRAGFEKLEQVSRDAAGPESGLYRRYRRNKPARERPFLLGFAACRTGRLHSGRYLLR
jgi:acetyl-CoA synthetase